VKNSGQTSKKKFKIFDMNRDGKGVYEEENRKPTLGFFFKLFFRKFNQLLQLNLLMLLMVIPLIVLVCIFIYGEKTPTATDMLYAPLYGIDTALGGSGISSLLDITSIQMRIPILRPFVIILVIALFALMALTWGWHNVGSAYVLRGLFRGDAVFVFSDYFYGIKKNFKQAFFLGIFDFICCAVLIADFLYFYNLTGSFGFDFMYFTIFALVIIWIMMRFYLYNLLVTFNLKNFKIIKNAFIFSILGIKRNIMAFLGIALLIAIHVILIFGILPYGLTVVLILPFVYILAAIGFMGTYAAYPVIQKYMITPYENQLSEATDDSQT